MAPFVTAELGFLVAVLWFDLMHDVQVLGKSEQLLPAAIRDSVAGYYRRVTIEAFPMNRLVALVMLTAIGSLTAQLVDGDAPRWVSAVALAFVLAATGLAFARTVRNAQRLGRQNDDAVEQSRLARTICADHFTCLAAILAALTLELTLGR